MKTQSAKAKGRRFQQWVRDKLIESLGITQRISSRGLWVQVVRIYNEQEVQEKSFHIR